MRAVVTAAEMREMDRRTINEVGISGLILMENAGIGILKLVTNAVKNMDSPRIFIICGKGNNGGDGMVVVRHLRNASHDVHAFLLGESGKLKGDALANYRMLSGMGVRVHEIKDAAGLKKTPGPDLIVDALLGTGVQGPVQGAMADVIAWMNAQGVPVISVDMPSGVDSDSGSIQGIAVRAAETGTMGEMKCGLVLPPGREMAGRVSVIDIGIPGIVKEKQNVRTWIPQKQDIGLRLPARPAAAHKGTFGKVAVLAGSTGMTGAAALSSRSVLMAGAGLVILGIPEGLNMILEQKLTEVITRPLPQTDTGSLSVTAAPVINELLEWADAAAVGPGLSDHPDTVQLLHDLIPRVSIPLVLDADGINAFEGQARLLEKRKSPWIITPHAGELARLTGYSIDQILADRISIARDCAARFHAVLVLKGSPTVIADPGGDIFLNPTGNSGMATAGSGDVLTGMIAGLLGQSVPYLDAALCGVYLHGLAGDLAAGETGQRSMLASDAMDRIGDAFRCVESGL